MKLAVLNHPEVYNISQIHLRIKHFKKNGFIIDGKWELEVTEYLEQNNIEWIKPKISFSYFWNNSYHRYFPDFYLPKYDRYIEVKGYETERDKEKYKCIKDLILIKGNDINKIRNNSYNIFEYL